MASTSLQLEDDQRFALMKFRRNVHEILQPHHDNHFLLRWLRARSWNPEAAEKMLRDSMEWRRKWGVDTTLKEWKAPDVLETYFPSGQAGFDKDGAPVVIIPFAGLDVWGLLHSISKSDIVKRTIIELEGYLEAAAKAKVHQVTAIIDMDGFVLKQYAWRPAAEMVITLIQMYEANYPEILKQCFIINAPSVFSLAFTVVKKFLNEYTLSKIQIFKSDPNKWQPVIQKYIKTEELPKHYGGELVDPDGNPRCPSKIRLGGKVPKRFYSTNMSAKQEDTTFQTAVIKRGGRLNLDYIVAEEGCVLRWEFRSDNHDVGFGVLCRDEDDKESVVVDVHRVRCQHATEVGVVACKFPATYTIIFDNSYSLLRSKKIHYNIILTVPLTQLNISTLPENMNGTDIISDDTKM